MATTLGPRPRSQASAISACVAWWTRAMLVNTSWRSSPRARRGPPSGEWAITVIPSSAQRSTTPPRSARSSKGLIATWTAAIGASSTASSSCVRLTLQTPMRATRPSATSRASARIDVGHGVRGSGRVEEVEVDGQPAECLEARLAVGADRLRATVRDPRAIRPRHAAFRHDPRPVRVTERASEQLLVALVGARGVEHGDPGVEGSGDRLVRLLREPHAAEADV